MGSNSVGLVVLFSVFGMFHLALRAHQARMIHRERMAALDKGIDIKPILLNAAPAFGHRLYLVQGLVWLLAGGALGGVLAVTSPLFQNREHGPGDRLQSTLMRARSMRDLGATSEQIEAMEKEIQQAERRLAPPPNLGVVGSIPMAVGIAYLIFFAIEERRVRRLPPA